MALRSCLFHVGFILMLGQLCAQPGSIDQSYGTQGTTSIDLGGLSNYGLKGLLTNGDKLLVLAGKFNGSDTKIGLIRFLSSGALDSTFGIQGRTIWGFEGYNNATSNMVQQPDGKIIVGGLSAGGATQRVFLARFEENGALDLSFGSNGSVIYPVPSTYNSVSGLALQPDGKLLLSRSNLAGTFLLRYNADGSPDLSFSGDGMVSAGSTITGMNSNQSRDIKLLADGRIVVLGIGANGPDDQYFLLLCYDQNGTLDTSFGLNGVVLTDMGDNETAYAVTQRSDGRIVAAGVSDGNMAVAQYGPDGSLDNTFGGDGTVTLDFDWPNQARDVVEIAGQLVAVGTIGSLSFDDIAVVQFNDDGSLDAQFGIGGQVVTNIWGTDAARSIVPNPDGSFFVVGSYNQNTRVVVVKYHGLSSVGVGEDGRSSGAVVAPNPFDEELVLTGTSAGGQLCLLDALGRPLLEASSVASRSVLNTSSLAPGAYWLIYVLDGRVLTRAVVKY